MHEYEDLRICLILRGEKKTFWGFDAHAFPLSSLRHLKPARVLNHLQSHRSANCAYVPPVFDGCASLRFAVDVELDERPKRLKSDK